MATRRITVFRSAQAQAILEGACILPILILFSVLLCFLLLNTSIVGSYNYRLNAIATEGARQYCAGRWWAGMERFQGTDEESNFDEEGAKNDVKTLIAEEVKAMGYADAVVSNLQLTPRKALFDGQDYTIMAVSFDVSGLPVFSGGFFPSKISLHASGIASDAEHATAKHGQALIHVVDPEDSTKQRGVRVPVLNATIGNNLPADPSQTDAWLKAGQTLGTPPIVTMNIYCENFGLLSMQGTDKEGNTIETKTRDWDPLRPR
jgi:hypothetical protein